MIIKFGVNLKTKTVIITEITKKSDVENIFQKVLEKFDLDQIEGMNIVIKPNLCRPMSPETGATTDTYLVELLIKELIKRKPRKIIIIESDTYYRTADECFERMGYLELKEKYNIELINISKDENYYVKMPFLNENILFPRVLIECDYFISFAKLKTYVPVHQITLCLKNLWGCYPVKLKASKHPFIKEITAGLVQLVKPDLCIVDGIIGMEGPGPIDGTPKKMNILAFGNDALATDIICAKIMGFNPIKIPMIKFLLRKRRKEIKKIKTNIKLINKIKSNFIINYLPFQIYFYRIGFRLQRIGKNFNDFGRKIFFFNIYEYILYNLPKILDPIINRFKSIIKKSLFELDE